MKEMESYALKRIQGFAADGLVTVTVSTTGELLGVHVYPGAYEPRDPPGLANMGDMVVEALHDARERAVTFVESLHREQPSQRP